MQEKRYRATVPALIQCYVFAESETQAKELARKEFAHLIDAWSDEATGLLVRINQTEVIEND